MSDKPAALWIDWARSLRSRTLAGRLDAELVEIHIGGNRLRRYLKSIRRTVAALRRARPDVVIATNPSLMLGLLLLGLRRWYRFALVSDAHYVGVRALRGGRLLQSLLDFHNARADLVIVTNERHAAYVAALGGRAYVCPDPLPDLGVWTATLPVPDKAAFLVCSFERDEPFEAVFRAFSGLPQYTLFVSGRYTRAGIDPARFPWVRFLGYVSEQEYYAYLKSCAVIVDLTELEDCLLCGAYEALAARKPLLISHTSALASYFGAAAVLTENTAEQIAANVQRAYAQRGELAQKANQWVAGNEEYMGERIATLKQVLRSLNVRLEAAQKKPVAS
jgi:glycosyltransferase involved in cell wall biosynthesis